MTSNFHFVYLCECKKERDSLMLKARLCQCPQLVCAPWRGKMKANVSDLSSRGNFSSENVCGMVKAAVINRNWFMKDFGT